MSSEPRHTSRKKPRHCSNCQSTEHRADFHGSKRERETPPSPVTASMAVSMHTMLDPAYVLWLVTEGVIAQALGNATRAVTNARDAGVKVSDSIVRALAELELRARDIPPETIERARELRRTADEAQAAYQVEARKITEQLGYKPRS